MAEDCMGSLSEESRVTSGGGSSEDGARLHGEAAIRGSARLSLSSIHEGRFGRMFRRLPPLSPLPQDVLIGLAERMREQIAPVGWGGEAVALDNPTIPAGYTYLGQFIDHDITFDPVSSLQRINDPDALHDFRSPRFDLDSLYGSGPVDEPFQYRKGTGGMEFLIEPNEFGAEDLPRNSQGVALIGDPRNDENVIVSQLQLLFLRAHNKIGMTVAGDPAVAPEDRFTETQRRVRWLYQWIVMHDYLPRIIGDQVFDAIAEPQAGGRRDIKCRYYNPHKSPYMPVEFSVAAFRFGHSQVRSIYHLNDIVRDRQIFAPGPLLPDPRDQDLRGFRPIPQHWDVHWPLFFGPAGDANVQLSRKIDAMLVPALFDLPDGGGSLALRNLMRGQALGLPSGQDVARRLRETVLTAAELGDGVPEPTPLWFYLLKESELQGGELLGPVGGKIVGEVLLGLLELDPQSWFSQDPDWTPQAVIPGIDVDGDGAVTMADVAAFVAQP